MKFDEQSFFNYYLANPHISILKIAKDLRCSHNTLRKLLKKHGISRKRQKFSPEFDANIGKEYRELRSVIKVAEKYNIDEGTVRNILKRIGIKTPGNSCKPKPNLTSEQQQIFNDHQPLVKYLIKKIGSWRAKMAGMELEDMLQAGTIGLWRAALTYDKSHGTVFSTHATKAIEGEIFGAIEEARYGRRKRGRALIDHSKFVLYEETRDQE